MTFTDTIKKYRTTGRGRLFFALIVIAATVGVIAAGHGFRDGSRAFSRQLGRAGTDSIEALRQALERGSAWLDPVKVSDEQRTQLLAIVDRHEPGLRRLDLERGRLAEEFASALRVDRVNPTDTERLHTDTRELGGRAIDESVALFTDAVQVLTPEQRAQLAARWLARQCQARTLTKSSPPSRWSSAERAACLMTRGPQRRRSSQAL